MNWPPNYIDEFIRRQKLLTSVSKDFNLISGAIEYYSIRPVAFIEDWCITYDPRNTMTNLPVIMPFLLFPRQKEFVNFIIFCIDNRVPALCEKSRDMGVTWLACAISVWLWLFKSGSSIGFGSRKENLVDRLGDPDSILEKIRMIINYLPRWLWPVGFKEKEHVNFMKIMNPENGATITGEAGDEIGRGGRKTIYWKDESAHYERPERIEAALSENTDIPVDISSVCGTTNVFYRKRAAGELWKTGKKIDKKKHKFLFLIGGIIPGRIKNGMIIKSSIIESRGYLICLHKKSIEIIPRLLRELLYLQNGLKQRLMHILNLKYPLREV
jgi:hypothetical protein